MLELPLLHLPRQVLLQLRLALKLGLHEHLRRLAPPPPRWQQPLLQRRPHEAAHDDGAEQLHGEEPRDHDDEDLVDEEGGTREGCGEEQRLHRLAQRVPLGEKRRERRARDDHVDDG